jgi:hypothetical protein
MDKSASHGEEVDSGPPSDEIIKAGHEPDNIDPRPIVKFAVGVVVIAVLTYIGLWGMLRFFESENRKDEPPLSPMATQQERLPPEPRLQMMPGSKSELKTPVGPTRIPAP